MEHQARNDPILALLLLRLVLGVMSILILLEPRFIGVKPKSLLAFSYVEHNPEDMN